MGAERPKRLPLLARWWGIGVLIAVLSSAQSTVAPPDDLHPYLERSLERTAGYEDLSYTAKATISEEISGRFVELEGRVSLRRGPDGLLIAIDGRVKEDGVERGVAIRQRGDVFEALDRRDRRVVTGTHPRLFGDSCDLVWALADPWIGRVRAELDPLAAPLRFQRNESFAGVTCHLFHGRGPLPFGAYTPELAFDSTDGLPRRRTRFELLPGAEVATIRWRLLEWTPRPYWANDPFRLPAVDAVTRVDPAALRPARFAKRPVHDLTESTEAFTSRFDAVADRPKVVVCVSPT